MWQRNGPNHTGLPPNLHPMVRPCISPGRSAPGTGLQACCGLHRCLYHRLGGHARRACSIGGLDGSPTALTHQLPRVVSSMPWFEPSQRVLMRQAHAGPHGQHCDHCVHQLTRWSTLPSHVATRFLLWSQKHLKSPKRSFICVSASKTSFGKGGASAMFWLQVERVCSPSVIQSH